MAFSMYDSGREGFGKGQINWETDNIVMRLQDSTYSFDAGHATGSVLAASNMGIGSVLANKVCTDGNMISDPYTFTGIGNGASMLTSVVYAKQVDANPDNDILIAYTDNVTGWPFTPDNDDVPLVPSGPGGAWWRL